MARLTVDINDKLYKRFKEQTKLSNTDVSKVIRGFVISWLDQYEQPIKPKRKGITFAHKK